MSVVIDEFLREICSCFGVRKFIFRQSRVINFQIFPLGANHGGLNLTILNISSPNFYLLNVGMSERPRKKPKTSTRDDRTCHSYLLHKRLNCKQYPFMS